MNLTEKYLKNVKTNEIIKPNSNGTDSTYNTYKSVEIDNQGEFLSMYKKCVIAINEQYEAGCFKYIETNRPELFQKLQKMELKIDELWDVDLDMFKEVLEEYHDFNLKLIQIFKESKNEFKQAV